jgi:alpha-aminoadipate carrier protein LysW
MNRARGYEGAQPPQPPKCPECDAEVTIGSDAVKGEIVSCPDCGAELEVREVRPLALALAPAAEEDWGE